MDREATLNYFLFITAELDDAANTLYDNYFDVVNLNSIADITEQIQALTARLDRMTEVTK